MRNAFRMSFVLTTLIASLLTGCGKKEEAKLEKAAEKVATDVKADARELEAREASKDRAKGSRVECRGSNGE
jgi:predicted small lipoprotein YifL